jgi:hypothetical protein
MSEVVIFPGVRLERRGSSERRWRVRAVYAGVPYTADIEELEEMQELIERWPDWNTLDGPITIHYLLAVQPEGAA